MDVGVCCFILSCLYGEMVVLGEVGLFGASYSFPKEEDIVEGLGTTGLSFTLGQWRQGRRKNDAWWSSIKWGRPTIVVFG
jgi:hypothetical protein